MQSLIIQLGTGIRGLMRGMATLPQGSLELSAVKGGEPLNCLWRTANASPDLRLPSQLVLVPNLCCLV